MNGEGSVEHQVLDENGEYDKTSNWVKEPSDFNTHQPKSVVVNGELSIVSF